MSKKNILLICGGGGEEHEISLVSAQYIKESIESLNEYNVFYVEIKKDGSRVNEAGEQVELRKGGLLFQINTQEEIKLHYAIPCIHGPPGETGEIQAVFEMMKLPYLGCGPEASMLCFNKISTKLWLNAIDVPNSPFLFLGDQDKKSIEKAKNFFDQHKSVYIKAATQGSSVGCYFVDDQTSLEEKIKNAFTLSSYVLIEKNIEGRELEIAVFQQDGKIFATIPGEIICPGKFYDFDQKYSNESKTETNIIAKNVSTEIQEQMKSMAIKAFSSLKLKDLSRIDFFLTKNNEILLNEINTFPGMTPISMFPKMMENQGIPFRNFIHEKIKKNIRS